MTCLDQVSRRLVPRVTQEDVFEIAAVDLGVLKKLRIRHDNSQASAGWFLDRVEIVDNKDDAT